MKFYITHTRTHTQALSYESHQMMMRTDTSLLIDISTTDSPVTTHQSELSTINRLDIYTSDGV